MEASKIQFRSSSCGYIMPGPREKKGEIQETTKTHLIDVFVSAKYGRREDVEGKFLEKGNQREEDSITLLSRVNKMFYKKNSQRLENGFISGECDVFIGKNITSADETFDTKTSWSAHTFFRAQNKKLDDNYYWQGMCYMWLTGAKKHTVAYCLVNGLAQVIMDEKRKASYRFGPDPDTDPAYIAKCKQIEINHIFDLESFINENPWFEFHNDLSGWKYNIPMEERLYTFSFNRDEAAISAIQNRVLECRAWMDLHLFKTQALVV